MVGISKEIQNKIPLCKIIVYKLMPPLRGSGRVLHFRFYKDVATLWLNGFPLLGEKFGKGKGKGKGGIVLIETNTSTVSGTLYAEN